MTALSSASLVEMVVSRVVISWSRVRMRLRRVGSGVVRRVRRSLRRRGGVEGLGDVEVAEGVAPLGGDEGGVGFVVEAEGFAAGRIVEQGLGGHG